MIMKKNESRQKIQDTTVSVILKLYIQIINFTYKLNQYINIYNWI